MKSFYLGNSHDITFMFKLKTTTRIQNSILGFTKYGGSYVIPKVDAI